MPNSFHPILFLRQLLGLNAVSRAPVWPAEIPENWHVEFIVHLAAIVRPKLYVELGLYQCELFNKVIPYAHQLIGIDMNAEAGTFMNPSSGKTTFIQGTTDDFHKTLQKSPKSIDLLFIDADHTQQSVRNDFQNYFPFVSNQGLIIFHDSYPKNAAYAEAGYSGDGYKAIEQLSHDTREYEMVTIPFHPGVTICRKRTKQLSW